jgi:ketosteroid isomerase-like protein
MIRTFVFIVSLFLTASIMAFAQNTNSSTTTTARPRTTNTNQSAEKPKQSTDAKKPATVTKTPTTAAKKAAVTPKPVPGSDAVIAAFNNLLDGIRHADVKAVTSVYWNSPRLVLFNNNGTVTKGWEQVRKNRESSYPELKDVKLDVRDVSVTMLGKDGAVVSCLWTQTQTFKGAPETASGRMTLVFKRVGNTWKAIHLHTSTDKPNPASILPSEQTPAPKASPTPTPAVSLLDTTPTPEHFSLHS